MLTGVELVHRAAEIAHDAHEHQREESTNAPYVLHVERVASMFDETDLQAVAWLHDVIEDAPDWSLNRLRQYDIPEHIICAVDLLTKMEGEQYAKYIGRIKASANRLAVLVKLGDLRDHLRPNCPARLRPRYIAALGELAELGHSML